MLDKNRVSLLKQTIQNSTDFDEQAELFRCIGDPTCLKLLSLLSSSKELCVSDLTLILGISMPAVSHQLKKLRNVGLVTRTRNGQIICYSMASNDTVEVVKTILHRLSI